ncbi:MAG: carbohydrate-binding domain-containing protein [Lachnospiraceae bacterium]|nr:carbohydrate-binding domain-containing protein [Lachnospiraceae bacterium]
MNYKNVKNFFNLKKNNIHNRIIRKGGAVLLAGMLSVSLAACGQTSGSASSLNNGTATDSLADTVSDTSLVSTADTASSTITNGSSISGETVSFSAGSTESDIAAALSSYNSGVSELTASGITEDLTASYIDTTDLFTDRDLDPSYSSSDAIPVTLSDSGSSCNSSAVSIDGSTLTITAGGIYELSGTLSDGQIVVDADGEKVQLVLNGVSISNDSSAAIYVKQADKVFITLAEGTENVLSTTGEYVDIDENSIDAVIFSKDDLALNGAGTLTITNGYGHGIVSKDDLKITSGTYNITASSSGINGKDSVRICGGSFSINAGTDCIHSSNDEDETKGYVYINGGSFDLTSESDAIDGSSTIQIDGGSFMINAGDDAIHSNTVSIINNGYINVTDSYEGLEGNTVVINGGEIHIKASDDGINAAGGNDSSGFGPMGFDMFSSSASGSYIMINGGYLDIDAGGDGLDANGSLYVTDGYTLVNGPTDNGNAALDYDGNGVITGGTFIALGTSGMALNFTSATQGAMLVNLNGNFSSGDEISLTDSEGNVYAEFTASKTGNSVLISTPDITSDGNYTLSVGSSTTEISMGGNYIYGSGTGFGMGGGMGGFGGGRQGGRMDGQGFNNQNGTDSTNDQNNNQGMNGQGGFGGGRRGDWQNSTGENSSENGEMPQLPEGFDGEMPEDFEGQMPGGFNGERPQPPEGFEGGMPGAFGGEMPEMPETDSQTESGLQS